VRCRKLRPVSIADSERAVGATIVLNLVFRLGEVRGDALHCRRDVFVNEFLHGGYAQQLRRYPAAFAPK